VADPFWESEEANEALGVRLAVDLVGAEGGEVFAVEAVGALPPDRNRGSLEQPDPDGAAQTPIRLGEEGVEGFANTMASVLPTRVGRSAPSARRRLCAIARRSSASISLCTKSQKATKLRGT